MRVGIISRQRIVNYGSYLHAFALKSMIEELGNEVYFIDYRDENDTFNYAEEYSGHLFYLKRFYHKVKNRHCNHFYLDREYLFKKKLLKSLGISKKYNDSYACDAVVIGSDEIFNICEQSPWGKSTSMLGSLVHKNQILISYAASFGYTTKELIKEEKLENVVADLLNKFDDISVRDANSVNIVKALTGKIPYKNLDPVLIYDFTKYMPQHVRLKNYLVVYGYDYRINDEFVIKNIKKLAKEENLKIVALGMEQSWADINYLPHPFELLALIKNAKYVVTDTFHGTVFSIKFQKNFITLIRDTNKEKLTDLLTVFDLLDRKVDETSDIINVLKKNYDKRGVQNLISKEIIRTHQYLEKYLSN